MKLFFMRQRNIVRNLVTSFFLILVIGTLTVKSVHCAFISHDQKELFAAGQTTVSQDGQGCLICNFDFYPVILHSLNLLPDVSFITYAELISPLCEFPAQRIPHLFQLRAPPVA